jgi:hypothetical protein
MLFKQLTQSVWLCNFACLRAHLSIPGFGLQTGMVRHNQAQLDVRDEFATRGADAVSSISLIDLILSRQRSPVAQALSAASMRFHPA